jgi:hypothetical protein
LSELVEAGIMQVSGKGRSVSYGLASLPAPSGKEKSEGTQLGLKMVDNKQDKEE